MARRMSRDPALSGGFYNGHARFRDGGGGCRYCYYPLFLTIPLLLILLRGVIVLMVRESMRCPDCGSTDVTGGGFKCNGTRYAECMSCLLYGKSRRFTRWELVDV